MKVIEQKTNKKKQDGRGMNKTFFVLKKFDIPQ